LFELLADEFRAETRRRREGKSRKREEMKWRSATVSVDDLNAISGQIVDAAIAVHSELGPGLLESVYEIALAYELRQRGFLVERQIPVPVQYRGIRFDEGYRLDLVVNDLVIIEVKSIEAVTATQKTSSNLPPNDQSAARLDSEFQCQLNEGWNFAHSERHSGIN
jgi:GxxExxY protein